MMKSLSPLIVLGFVTTPQIATAALSADYNTLLNQYYTISMDPTVDHVAARKGLDSKLNAMTFPTLKIPFETLKSVKKNVASNIAGGGNGYVGSTALPTNIYQMGPPAAWVKFLAQQISQPGNFVCHLNGAQSNRQNQMLRGKILQPIIREVAFGSEHDANLSSQNRNELKNLYDSYYQKLTLKTNSYDWNINPGVMLQYGARAGDPRAANVALALVKGYANRPDPNAVDHLQDAMFALEMYYSRTGRKLDDPLTVEVGKTLDQALESQATPDYVKSKIHELQRIATSTSEPPQQPQSTGTH